MIRSPDRSCSSAPAQHDTIAHSRDPSRRKIRKGGAVALAVLDLIPPPFPFTPFVLAAGALDVKQSMFFTTLTVCRLFRFGIEAALAAMYGKRIIAWMDSDLFHEIVFAF